jgi:hypothetical protein
VLGDAAGAPISSVLLTLRSTRSRSSLVGRRGP